MPLTVAQSPDPRLRQECTLAAPIAKGAGGKLARLVQEWLGLNKQSVSVDGAFGDATETAVRSFQQARQLGATGVVDQATMDALAQPILNASAAQPPAGAGLNDAIVYLARAHFAQLPHEIGGPNMGPWVRLYMDGREGEQWAWCAGFVFYVLDQASRTTGRQHQLSKTFSCDLLAADAKTNNRLLTSAQVNNAAQPGWIFLHRRSSNDWTHTGLVTGSNGATFGTVEGNTNDNGSRDGVEVLARTRTYGEYDFVRI